MTTKLNWLTATPIAHRGFHDQNHEIWENSLSAFSRAADAGFAIECDVHLANDGVIVVFHDDGLKRITGADGDVRKKSSNELSQLSIGPTSDHVPTLKQMLDLVSGRVPIIIELKGRYGVGEDDGFAEIVLKTLEGYQGQIALMSFDQHLLRDLKKAGSPWPIGLTAEGDTEENVAKHNEGMKIGIDFISYYYAHLPNPFIEAQRKLNIPVITWTVKTEEAERITFTYADQMTFEGFDPRIKKSNLA